LKLDFNSETGDVFTLTLNLNNNIASSTSNFDTLASNISRLGVSVTGGAGLTADSAGERLAGISFQVGSDPEDTIEFSINAMDTAHLGIAKAGIDTQENASSAITASDYAIKRISGQRSNLGAIENTLNAKLENLQTEYENLVSAESLIRDVDFAKEMTEFTKASILQQVAVAMMAQANSIPEHVLYLLRN
jgi:flagellin